MVENSENNAFLGLHRLRLGAMALIIVSALVLGILARFCLKQHHELQQRWADLDLLRTVQSDLAQGYAHLQHVGEESTQAEQGLGMVQQSLATLRRHLGSYASTSSPEETALVGAVTKFQQRLDTWRVMPPFKQVFWPPLRLAYTELEESLRHLVSAQQEVVDALRNRNDSFFVAAFLTALGLLSLCGLTVTHAGRQEAAVLKAYQRLEQSLQASEKRFRRLFASAPVAMSLSTREGVIVAINPRFQQLFGYTLSDIPTTADWWTQAYPDPHYRALMLTHWNILIAGLATGSEHCKTVEQRVRCKDGRERLVCIEGTCLAEDLLSSFLDVTEQRQAEQALTAALQEQRAVRLAMLNQMEDAIAAQRQAETTAEQLRQQREAERQLLNHLDTVANASPALFWSAGLDKGCDWFNRRWLEFTGRTLEQELGNGWTEGVHPDDYAHCLSTYVQAFEARSPFSMEYRLRRYDGEYRWLLDQGLPRYDADGRFIGYIGSCLDISEERQMRETLHELNATLEERVAQRTAELQALNQSLESFVYSVSHDLKAPLRSIAGYSRLLQEDYAHHLDDEGRLFLTHIRDSVTRMEQLIDDLLAYSRMERKPLERLPINPRAVVDDLVQERQLELDEKRMTVRIALPDTAVLADPHGLTLVLRNLLDNAIKFTSSCAAPSITIGGQSTDDSVTIWVRDNGIGFDPRYQERIFEIFQRLHRQEDYPGTGIGLALVKKAMERMGGQVWAESRPGEGAVFYLTLPRAELSPAADPTTTGESR